MTFPLNSKRLKTLHARLETPALLVWQPQLIRNIQNMQHLANQFKTALRPHTKTHKSPFIAKWQLQAGAKGITVAKLSEAEVMFQAGMDDIFIANQITHPLKLQRLRLLHQKIKLIIGLDNKRQIGLLRPFFEDADKPLAVRIEINSGLDRCGMELGDQLIDLAQRIAATSWLKLDGIFTHAGHVYGAKSRQEVETIGRQEGTIMAEAKALLEKAGIPVPSVSVGSTPTAPFSVQNPAVTEIRPGNYVFFDAMQIFLGAAKLTQCSLFVLATVISRPKATRLVIDAGSKALHTDGASLTGHFGLPVNTEGQVERLSEEHGILHVPKSCMLDIGDPLIIIPNHACAVANLFEQYYFIDKALNPQKIPIEARGRSQ